MHTRRAAMTTIGAAALLIVSPVPVRYAWAQSGPDAVGLVQSTSGQLVAIVNSRGTPQEKRRRLQEVLNSSADVDDIARFCLGRFWRIATPDQRQQYMPLFHDLLTTKIADHLGEYDGVRVTIGAVRAAADTEIVVTTVERPKDPAQRVDWVVSTSTGKPKIIDLLAEGTSLRLTQSSDFAAYLARHQYNIHELIEAMRQMVSRQG